MADTRNCENGRALSTVNFGVPKLLIYECFWQTYNTVSFYTLGTIPMRIYNLIVCSPETTCGKRSSKFVLLYRMWNNRYLPFGFQFDSNDWWNTGYSNMAFYIKKHSKHYNPKNYACNVVYKSTITDIVTVWNFDVLFNKFNIQLRFYI
jgi:hypothetical protein